MGVSLLYGRLQVDDWQTWALVNKGIGWLMLLGLALAVPYRPGRDRGATDAAPPGTARQPQAHTGIP